MFPSGKSPVLGVGPFVFITNLQAATANTETLEAIKTEDDCGTPGTAALQGQPSGIPNKAMVPSLGSSRLGSQKQAGSSEQWGRANEQWGPLALAPSSRVFLALAALQTRQGQRAQLPRDGDPDSTFPLPNGPQHQVTFHSWKSSVFLLYL